jgi:small nuclear ribonucleoprotein
MFMEPSRKPLNVLTKQLNAYVEIFLKSGVVYEGRMVKCDGHMNVLLDGATEKVGGKLSANYGSVLIRGNNVLYIRVDIVPPK